LSPFSLPHFLHPFSRLTSPITTTVRAAHRVAQMSLQLVSGLQSFNFSPISSFLSEPVPYGGLSPDCVRPAPLATGIPSLDQFSFLIFFFSSPPLPSPTFPDMPCILTKPTGQVGCDLSPPPPLVLSDLLPPGTCFLLFSSPFSECSFFGSQKF